MRRGLVILLVSLLILSLAKPICAKEITLSYWTHADRNREDLEIRLIEEFMARNPGVTIEHDVTGSTDHRERLLPAFAAGRGPAVASVPSQWIAPLIDNGAVAPLDAEAMGFPSQAAVIDAYVQGSLDYVIRDGVLYGVPLEVTNWNLFINNIHFQDAGLDPVGDAPKTWEELLEVADKLTIRRGDVLERRGFDFRYAEMDVWFEPMIEQAGGVIFSDDYTKTLVNSPATLRVLEYFREFGPKGRNLGGPSYVAAHSAFYTDKDSVSMGLSGLYQVLRIRRADMELYDNFTCAALPRFEGGRDVGSRIYMHSYMVNPTLTPEEQEMAWRFVAYLTAHGEDYLAASGLVQPRLELTDTETFKDLKFSQLFIDEMVKGRYSEYVPNRNLILESYIAMTEAAMLETTDLQEILSRAERAINGHLRD